MQKRTVPHVCGHSTHKFEIFILFLGMCKELKGKFGCTWKVDRAEIELFDERQKGCDEGLLHDSACCLLVSIVCV